MSIIEKAAKKLENSALQAASQQSTKVEPKSPRDESLIESALARQKEVAPQPVHSPELRPEPTLNFQEEPEGTSQIQSINLSRMHRMGMITPDAERSQIAEEFRIIKRPLIANAFGHGAPRIKNGNLIMVTSSLPGEGKSFCAINLAVSMAMEMDRTVLLVDADVARPRVPEYLGLHTDLGLLDVLRDKKMKLSDVMIKTDVAKLTVLPAGRTYKRATELLASTAMTDLVEDIGNRYHDRIIIFDSPPLLATSESSVLATHMGQIVMVVEAEKTSQEAVQEALSHIKSCEVVSMLLNKATPSPGADYYYGYYGSYGK